VGQQRQSARLDTIKKHVGHVLGKLGAANRTGAIARARELSLIPRRIPPQLRRFPSTCLPSGATAPVCEDND